MKKLEYNDCPATMACMICGQQAMVRVTIEDRAALVRVCLCWDCASQDPADILPPIYNQPTK
jgi:hypothetical protein